MSDMPAGLAAGAGARAALAPRWQARLWRLVEGAEKAVFVGLFLALLAQIGPQLASHPLKAVFLAPNAFVAALVLTRRKARRLALDPLDWAIAVLASAAPLLLAATTRPPEGVAGLVGQGVMVTGMALSLTATVALGRSFGVVPADRGIKRGGPYRLVRHPMYAGYTLWQLGFVLSHLDWRNALAFALALGLQLVRISREERLLGGDPAYRTYKAKVRRRLVPFVY